MNKHIAPLFFVISIIFLATSCVDEERISSAVITSTPIEVDTSSSNLFNTQVPTSSPTLSVTITEVPAIITLESTPQTLEVIQQSSTPQILITPTPIIVFLEELKIKGDDTDGSDPWYAPDTGTYIISFLEGAYSGWDNADECPSEGCWKTTIFAYRGCEITRDWRGDLMEPINPSFRIGLDPWQPSPEAAEEDALDSDPKRVEFQKGECVKFVAIDGVEMAGEDITWTSYTDNPGVVTLGISLLTYPGKNE